MPEISVIIPCYNVEEVLLLRCLNSVLVQDFTDYEVILVDDGSRDEYKEALYKAEKMDERIRLFRQVNKGVSAARNEGVKVAEGKFVIFVDADDILVPYFFSEVIEIQQKTQADFIIGGNARLKKEETDYERDVPIHTELLTDYTGSKMKPYMVGELFWFGSKGGYIGRGPWTRLVKREIAAATPFDTELTVGEDIVWNLQLLKKCKTVCVAYRIWYLYYINEKSATRRYNGKILESITLELDRIAQQLDMDNDREYTAYCTRVLDELKRLYLCYLGNRQCTLSKKERKDLIHKLYRTEPWKCVGEKRYYRSAGRKYKVKSLLYRYKMLFLSLKIMSIMGK